MKKELQDAIEQLTASLLELKKERLLASLDQSAVSHVGTGLEAASGLQQAVLEDRQGDLGPSQTVGAVADEANASWQCPGSLVRCGLLRETS